MWSRLSEEHECDAAFGARVESRLTAYEAQIQELRDRAKALIDEFSEEPDDDIRFLLSERMGSAGSIALPYLIDLIEDEERSESIRYLSAVSALRLGDRGVSVSMLCEIVDGGGEWAPPAANQLARARVTEGLGPIRRALERVDPADRYVLDYLGSLIDLGGSLDDGLRAKLKSGAAEPWVVRAIDSY